MRFVILLLVLLLSPICSFAQEVNELTPDNIAKNTLSMPPEMRQKFMEKLQNMTPQQKAALTNQAKEAWQQMSPQNKEAIKAQAIEQYQNLSPEQKNAMKDQAMQKWQSMDAKDKQELTSQFQDILQGGLQGSVEK